jgi:predicted transposase/invertase (TIGR01784 family)
VTKRNEREECLNELSSMTAEEDTIISLRNDIIFKYVFGHEKNERILRALLNAILALEGENRIAHLTFINSINLKEYLKDKTSILDVNVKAEDSTGKRYNIEMQVRAEDCYIQRVLYYHDRLFTSQLTESESFGKLEKTMSISILSHILLCDEFDLHNIYRYGNIKSGRVLSDIKEIHFIELPKFVKDKPRQLMTKFEKWLYVLKFGEHYTDDPERLPDVLKVEEEIVMAIRKMGEASGDEVVRELIESREKARHIEATRLEAAEKKGLERGLEKGLERGLERGRHENALEIARKMKASDFDIESIMKMTSLTREEIDKL